MILTGPEIAREVATGEVEIAPFDPQFIEPNSYGFHLGETLIVYDDDVVDSFEGKRTQEIRIPETGYVMRQGRFYLGRTLEKMGSRRYASELYARLSTSTAGLFIQTSAPLGHTGAIIAWTLEMVPVHDMRVYPGMLIGKICFWSNKGEIDCYRGRYRNSTTVVSSLLSRGEP
jgi:dCTP deaminase